MKVAYAQFAPKLGNPGAVDGALDRLEADLAGADLVVLPELANSGYRFRSAAEARAAAEPIPESPFLARLAARCARDGRHLVTGFCERDGDDLYNSAVLLGPDGVIGRYRKLHLFGDEFDIFTPGDAGLPVFDVGRWRVGMLVCFDWVFPEAWRSLALAGADLVCHPSNLVLPGFAQRSTPVHALTNGIYVVTANRIGTERDLTFTGMSLVAGPRGEVLVEAGPEEETVGIATIDRARARDKMITSRNHLFDDRRPEEYAPSPWKE